MKTKPVRSLLPSSREDWANIEYAWKSYPKIWFAAASFFFTGHCTWCNDEYSEMFPEGCRACGK